MKTKSDSGLRIHKSSAVPSCTTAETLLHAAAALLGFFAVWLPLECAFRPSELGSSVPAICVGLAVCLVMAFFRRLGWERYAGSGALVCLAVFTAVFFSKITDGACLCWNAWCDARTAASGVLHLGRTVLSPADEQGACAMLFSIACAWTLAVLCDALAERCRAAIVLLSAALTALIIAVLTPESLGMSAAVGSVCAAALCALTPRTRSGRGPLAALLSPAALAVVLAIALAVCAAIPAVRGGEAFLALRGSVLERAHASRFETGNDGLPEGDFTALAGRTGTGRTMLTVSMEKAEPLYLHGFIGQSFTGTGWESMSNVMLAENSSLLYWLHAGGFYPQTQTGTAAAAIGGETELNGVTVTNRAACSRYVYAPYSAVTGSFAAETDALRLAESSVLTLGGGDRTASYSLIYQASSKTADWVQSLGEDGGVPLQSYLELESGYRGFVQDNYLEIPDETRDIMAPYLDAAAAARVGDGEMDAYLAVQCAQDFLDASLSYSEDVKVLPEGENFVKYTLETGKGYDFQYATLGVLALRYYGVPARYAEGYVVTEQLASQAAQGTAEISDDCAHAWVEVYQEGIGWLPLEMTPNYTEVMGAAPQAGNLSTAISERRDPTGNIGTEAGTGSGAYIRDGAEYDPEPEQNADDNENDGDSPENAKTPRTLAQIIALAALIVLAAVLLLAAIAAVLLAVRRRRTLNQRQAQFDDENASNAICWRFAYCDRLLKALGLDRGRGSMLTLAPRVSERLGTEYGEQFERMALLNREALFSRHKMTQDQRAEMADFCEKTAEMLRSQSKPSRRLRLKWIECLY